MGDPQDTLAAYHEVLGVLSCRTPESTRDTVTHVLRTSHAVQGLPAVPLAAIETMTYGCRVAEVMTICLTTSTMDGLCLALQAERRHVGELYGEELAIGRLRLEQADRDAGVPPPVPPRQAPRPPQPQPPLQPPQGYPAQRQPPLHHEPPPPQGFPAQGRPAPPLAAQWKPPPPGFRRALLTPGPGGG